MSDTGAELLSILAATLRLAAPLVLAALGGLFCERSGIIDIGLEGKMLGAAFAAAAAAAATGSAWAGLGAGVGVAVMLALIHAFAAVTQRGDQVVTGMALNILVAGLAPVLATSWFHLDGTTPALAPTARFASLALPGASALASVPLFGPLYGRVVSGHNGILYVAALAVPAIALVLRRTRFGLRLRAVGENPDAVETAGVSVAWLRYRALMLTGVLCGLAGAYLSIAAGAGFSRNMTAGRGYLALAALIFGRWRPLPTAVACLLFAFADAAQTRLQGVALPLLGVVPVELVSAIPYALTVLLLAGFVGAARAPRALGIPYRSRG
ncbi:MAG TPA: ABC transporter permease [Stellaceae bacterium]|nr:ABC transporter permease [Stellaceae bacterium]